MIENIPPDANSSSNTAIIVPTNNRTVSFYGLENIWTQDYSKNFPDFDLKTFLTVSPYGSKILNYYQTNDRLTDFLRNKLVDMIITQLYPYIIKHRLTHSQYNILCSKILNLFPSECSHTYYLSGERLHSSAVQAKGKLVYKSHNILYRSPDKTYVRKRKNSTVDPNETLKKRDRENTEGEKNAMTWLKHNRKPWDEVMRHWQSTFDIRTCGNFNTVAEFIINWPIIADPRAASLIEADFKCMYPDSKVVLQLAVLPRIIPPRGRKKDGKNHWKCSTTEAVHGILVHATIPGDIERQIENQVNRALKRKIFRHVQPYLLAEGPQLSQIQNIYLVIDKIHFHLESALKGLDTLFKCFFVLHTEYPVQSEHIWHIIQQVVYGIDIPPEKISSNIVDVVSFVKLD
ncbi:unnamed protein product [Psylliodes chrysocephalus]|uniref:Uncharacterized protein n=1 Tax=Psylliodes chrysocephalus TaxID=3402493 RepID=A0A9P0D8C4_9CUCU|nr:unnamed protein product [Psylliodes chrysocephala]